MPASESASAVLTRELARLATKLRLAHRRELGRLRQARTETTVDSIEGELARLEILAERAPADDAALVELAERASARARATHLARAAGQAQPLYRLARRAGLDDDTLDLFLFALAPEIDAGFGRAFYLLRSGGSALHAPDLATAILLLAPREGDGTALRAALAPSAPLVRLGLVELIGSESRPAGLSLQALLRVPSPVVAYLLGLPVHDQALEGWVTEGAPVGPLSTGEATLATLRAALGDADQIPILEGPTGIGRRDAARAIARERGRPLVEIEVARAPKQLDEAEVSSVLRLAWLLDAVILLILPEVGTSGDGTEPSWQAGVAALLSRYPGPIALSRSEAVPLPALPEARRAVRIPFPLPEIAVRERLWRSTLGERGSEVDPEWLARTYRLPTGELVQAARSALFQATARGPDAPPTMLDIVDAIDLRYAPQLQKVGRRLKLPNRLEDLVLEKETRESLEEMEATVRLRHQVLDEWKFARLVRGRGISALFYGEPGTGKTMAAGAIAASCGLALYQIDTAQVVSKWIGETEKNLAEVFRAAESSHAMLLFDEADAIFGKRTDVKSSTDRYANLQTNFLLSQIETFNGISILTTNRDSVMDPAFMRRLQFRVYFPMPDAVERMDLWRRCLDGHATGMVDYKMLAERLVMSGGYIRNAVLRAAYLAAKEDRPLGTEQLRYAAELVLRDAGKVI